MKNAVIYIRVSDQSQIDNNSLEQQEKACRAYAKSNDFEVIKVFREEGVSAKTVQKREQLQHLLAFCTKKRAIDAVIVYKVDRWTRNVEEGLAAEAYLSKNGTALVSASENIEPTPTGKFIKVVLMASAELDNNIKSQRVKDTMKTMFGKGYWCWKPPEGYRRQFDSKEKNKGLPLVLDENLAPIIKEIFIKASSGIYSRNQLAELGNNLGYPSFAKKELTGKAVERILKKSFYYGEMYAKQWKEYAKGVHTEIIDQDTWERANYKMFGKKTKYNHQDSKIYPLKGLLFCETCNQPMTSSNPRGNGGSYKHYMCNKCKKSFNTEKAHEQFETLLHQLRPTENILVLLKEMIKRDWDLVNGDAESLLASIDKQISETKSELVLAVKAKDSGDYPEDMAKEEIDKCNAKLISLKVSRSDVKIMEYNAEIVTNFFEHFIENLDRLWKVVDLPKKQALQKAIFPEGITCFAGEIRTAKLSPLFKQIELVKAQNGQNVTPRRIELRLTG